MEDSLAIDDDHHLHVKYGAGHQGLLPSLMLEEDPQGPAPDCSLQAIRTSAELPMVFTEGVYFQ
jgi:hypothetical protein